jgi:hypothetical protein
MIIQFLFISVNSRIASSKIYSKISQLSPVDKDTGGANEVYDGREAEDIRDATLMKKLMGSTTKKFSIF